MMGYNNNLNSLPSFDFIVFEKISKRKISNYLLDYVTNEFEAIISCPSFSRNGAVTPPSLSYDAGSVGAPNFNLKSHHHPDKTGSTFDYSGLPSPPLSTSPQRRNPTNASMQMASSPMSFNTPMPLRSYIEVIVQKSRIDTGTLLTSICYARRLRLKLFSTSKGMECTHHRIFLATLIITTKYIHDSAIKNKYWVDYSSRFFSASEINLMERQLLQVLDYKLGIPSHDFELLVNDVVQLHFQHKLQQYQCAIPSNEPFQWYPTKQNYQDSAYQSGPPSQTDFYTATTPVSMLQTLNPYKPSPPTLHQ